MSELLKNLAAKEAASWERTTSDSASAQALMADAYELAGRAYRDGDSAATARAEELMYQLSIRSQFAAPGDPTAAAVWSLLMQSKLVKAREQFGGCKPLSREAMRARLEGAVEEIGAHNHPVLDVLANANNKRLYQAWAKNWFGSCYGFSQQLASLVQRTQGKTKEVVLENLADEFTHKDTHDNLRERFYASIELSFDPNTAHDDEDWTAEATSLLNLRTGLCVLVDPWPALGCFYSVEGNWPPECRKHIALTQAMGCTEQEIEYWTEHGAADEDHAAEWLNVVEAECNSDVDRASAVDGAIVQLKTRRLMYDAIAKRIAELA